MKKRKRGDLSFTPNHNLSGRHSLRTIAGEITIAALVAGVGVGLVGLADSKHLEKYIAPTQAELVEAHRLGVLDMELDSYFFLREYKTEFEEAAKEYDLPVEFLANVFITENSKRLHFDDFKDKLGSSLGSNVSLGPCQVNVETARYLDEITEGKIEPIGTREEYIERLLDPVKNIQYMTRYLAYLKNRENRFPDQDSEEFRDNIEGMTVIATEYKIGPRNSEADEAKSNMEGYDAIVGLAKPWVYALFGTGRDIADRAMEKTRAFLEQHREDIKQFQ